MAVVCKLRLSKRREPAIAETGMHFASLSHLVATRVERTIILSMIHDDNLSDIFDLDM